MGHGNEPLLLLSVFSFCFSLVEHTSTRGSCSCLPGTAALCQVLSDPYSMVYLLTTVHDCGGASEYRPVRLFYVWLSSFALGGFITGFVYTRYDGWQIDAAAAIPRRKNKMTQNAHTMQRYNNNATQQWSPDASVCASWKYRYKTGNRHCSAYCRYWLFPAVPSDFTGDKSNSGQPALLSRRYCCIEGPLLL